MLLTQIEGGFTVVPIAAQENYVVVLQKLWGCAEKCQLNPKKK